MQGKTYAGILAVVVFAPLLAAFAKDQPAGFEQGTVLKEERQEVRSPETCCYSGTDTPLQSEYYAFEVSVAWDAPPTKAVMKRPSITFLQLSVQASPFKCGQRNTPCISTRPFGTTPKFPLCAALQTVPRPAG